MAKRPRNPGSTLTANQARVLRFVQRFVREHGFPPTHAEAARALGFRSPNAVAEHLRLMAKKGVVALTPNASRGVRVLGVESRNEPGAASAVRGRGPKPPPGRVRRAGIALADDILDTGTSPSSLADAAGLPLVGQVAAGAPLLAVEHVERRVAIDPAIFRPRADFLLRVRGDSMIDAGILSGDLVAVHKTPRVQDGAIAVVRLDDEVTVKRFRTTTRDGAPRVVLEPENAAVPPIVVDPRRTTVVIEGLVVGLLRSDRLEGRPR